MKTYIYPIITLLMLGVFTSCLKEYEAPPLTEPTYTGPAANITIAQLRARYANVTDPKLIDVDYILKAVVAGNDASGNIFNQLFLQDVTGGIIVSVAQSSLFNDFRVGQEVFINLHGLYIVTFGGQIQLGYTGTNANRIPSEVFNFYTHRNGWPQASRITARTVTMNALDDTMMATLVRFDNVYFEGHGELPFTEGDRTTNRSLRDGNGNAVIVRTSNFSNFAADILPKGAGTVYGMLTRFNNDWQLVLRDLNDLQNFGQPIPDGGGTTDPGTPGVTTYFRETFGNAAPSAAPWPFLDDYTGFDNTNVTFTNPQPGGRISVRRLAAMNANSPHLWFPAATQAASTATLIIEGINTSAGAGKNLILTYDVAANVSTSGVASIDLNVMTVFIDDVAFNAPSHVVTAPADSNRPYTVTLTGIPAKTGLKLEFRTTDTNTAGMRLANIAITSNDVIVIRP
jgi:hypothetical protein